jgi:hypothetical protein
MTDGETTPHWKNLFELNKARLDLAWKQFEHATSQRLTLFNFYIVFMGALFYAFGTTLKNDPTGIIHLGIGLFGAITGIIFGLLDQRNQYLYRMAEYNIYLLERTFLYDESEEHLLLIDPDGGDRQQRRYMGIIATRLEGDRNLRRIEKFMQTRHIKMETYRLLMPLFYLITVAVFWEFL